MAPAHGIKLAASSTTATMPSLSDVMAGALGGGSPAAGPGGVDDKELRQQMEALWKKLDTMAENDPDEYRRFQQQQAEEALAASAQDPVAVGASPALRIMGKCPATTPPAAAGGSAGRPGQEATIHVWAARAGLLPLPDFARNPASPAITPPTEPQLCGAPHSSSGKPGAPANAPSASVRPVVACISFNPPPAASASTPGMDPAAVAAASSRGAAQSAAGAEGGRQLHVAVHSAWIRAMVEEQRLAVLVASVCQWAAAAHALPLDPASRVLQVNRQWVPQEAPRPMQVLLPGQQVSGAQPAALTARASPSQSATAPGTGLPAASAVDAGPRLAREDENMVGLPSRTGGKKSPLIQVVGDI